MMVSIIISTPNQVLGARIKITGKIFETRDKIYGSKDVRTFFSSARVANYFASKTFLMPFAIQKTTF